MDVTRFDLTHMPEASTKLSLALGNFDGCHRGHQALFVKTSLDAVGVSGALFFATPFGNGPFLSSPEDKIRYALSSRLEALYVYEGGKDVYEMEPEEFMEQVLLPLGTTRVVVGEDFRFGKDRKGTPETLRKHFAVDVVPLLKEGEHKISSRFIKEALLRGDVEAAQNQLGKPYEVSGTIVEGFHNGRKLGYPTINLQPSYDYVLPLNGVYCGVAYVSGVACRAMINVGTNPTLGLLDKPIVEAYLLDYDKDSYGKKAYIGFLRRIRGEKRFESLEELKEQLRIDEATVREMLS